MPRYYRLSFPFATTTIIVNKALDRGKASVVWSRLP